MYRGAVGIRKSPVIRGTAAIAMGGVDVERLKNIRVLGLCETSLEGTNRVTQDNGRPGHWSDGPISPENDFGAVKSIDPIALKRSFRNAVEMRVRID